MPFPSRVPPGALGSMANCFFRCPCPCNLSSRGNSLSASFSGRLDADSRAPGSGSVLCTRIVCVFGPQFPPQENKRKGGTTWSLASWDAAGTVPHHHPPRPVPKGHTSSPSLASRLSQWRLPQARGGWGEPRGGTQQDRWTVPGPPACCLRGGRGGVLRDPVSTNVSFPRRGRRGRGGEGPI